MRARTVGLFVGGSGSASVRRSGAWWQRYIALSLGVALMVATLPTQPARANGVWDGGGDGSSWSDPLNWGNDFVPQNGDSVTIPQDAHVVVDQPTARLLYLTIAFQASLIVEAQTSVGYSVDASFIEIGGILWISPGTRVNTRFFDFQEFTGTLRIEIADSSTTPGGQGILFGDFGAAAGQPDPSPGSLGIVQDPNFVPILGDTYAVISHGPGGGNLANAFGNPSSIGLCDPTPGAPLAFCTDGLHPFYTPEFADNGLLLHVTGGDPEGPPVFDPIPDINVVEGDSIEVTPVVTDPEGDAFELTWGITDENGITWPIDFFGAVVDDGTFFWATTEAQGPAHYALYITATETDNPDSRTRDIVGIDVREHNEDPVLAPIGDKVATVGEELAFTVSATDPDIRDPEQQLTFTYDLGLGVLNQDSPDDYFANYSWVPTCDQSAEEGRAFAQTVWVFDDTGLFDLERFWMTVYPSHGDSDGDGITDSVDAYWEPPAPGIPGEPVICEEDVSSNRFTDHNGPGQTYGEIVAYNGKAVRVYPGPFDQQSGEYEVDLAEGVAISVTPDTPSALPWADLVVCGIPQRIWALTEVVETCGSLMVEVDLGRVTLLASDGAEIDVQDGDTVVLTDGESGVSIETLTGSITLTTAAGATVNIAQGMTVSGPGGLTDGDTDGYAAEIDDCDDAVAGINPGVPEILDGVDNNCDGVIDEGFSLEPDFDALRAIVSGVDTAWWLKLTLLAKIHISQWFYDHGFGDLAVNTLDSVLRQVDRQEGRHLTSGQAAEISTATQSVIEAIIGS